MRSVVIPAGSGSSLSGSALLVSSLGNSPTTQKKEGADEF